MKNQVVSVQEEMDFNLSGRGSDQSEISLIFHQTSSWMELYFQVLYHVDVVIMQPSILCA